MQSPRLCPKIVTVVSGGKLTSLEPWPGIAGIQWNWERGDERKEDEEYGHAQHVCPTCLCRNERLSLAVLAALARFLYQNYNNNDAQWPVVVAGLAPVGLVGLSSVWVLDWVIEWEIHAVIR